MRRVLFVAIIAFLIAMVKGTAGEAAGQAGPTVVTVRAETPDVVEDAGNAARFILRRTGDASRPLNVAYRLAGNALPEADYTFAGNHAAGWVLRFAPGSTEAFLTVTPVADRMAEPDEPIVLVLYSPRDANFLNNPGLVSTNYALGNPSAAVIWLRDDDRATAAKPAIVLSAPVGVALAGWPLTPPILPGPGPVPGEFMVTRAGPTNETLRVQYEVLRQSIEYPFADAGTDYAALSGEVILRPGEERAVIQVLPINRPSAVPQKSVTIRLRTSPAYDINGGDTVAMIIADRQSVNSPWSKLSVAALDASAAEKGNNGGRFIISRTGSTNRPLTVFYSLGGSATNGLDYEHLPGVVLLPAGAVSVTIPLAPVWDTLREPAEIVALRLEPSLTIPGVLPSREAYEIGNPATQSIIIENSGSFNLPPVTRIISPVSGSALTPGRGFDLQAEATDPDGEIARVEFFEGDKLIGLGIRDSAPGTKIYSFQWANVSTGLHRITVRATDNTGEITTSPSIYLRVGVANQLPVVALVGLTNNSTISLSPVLRPQMTLKATASDVDGEVRLVEFFANNRLIGAVSAPPYTFLWTNVVGGIYTLSARATDDLGDTAVSSPFSVGISAPHVPPVVSLLSPLTGSTLTGPGNVVVQAQVVDLEGTFMRLEFYGDNQLLAVRTAELFSVTWTNVPLGPHTVEARVYDSRQVARIQARSSFTMAAPNRPPIVSWITPTNGATFIAPASIKLQVNAADGDGDLDRVEFFDGIQPVGTLFAPGINQASLVWSNAPLGDHALVARAYDRRDAVSTSTVVNVKVALAIGRPTVSIFASEPFGSEAGPTSAEFTVVRSPVSSQPLRVEYLAANGGVINAAAINDYEPLAGFVVIPAGEAAATIRVMPVRDTRAEADEVLRLSLKPLPTYEIGDLPSAMITIGNQNLPPQDPLTVTLLGPVDGMSLERFEAFSLAARVSPDGIGIERVVFYDGTNVLESTTRAPYSAMFYGRFPGEHRLFVEATDTLGRVAVSPAVIITVPGASPSLVTIRSTAPTVLENKPLPAGKFTISRTGDLSRELFVQCRAEGTARAGFDYTTIPSLVRIPAGAASVTVPVTPLPDRAKEPDETVVLRLVLVKYSPGTRIAPELDFDLGTETSATVTILDDDATNQPPLVQMVFPSPGAQVRAGASVLFRADAVDLEGLITQVEIVADDRVIASFTPPVLNLEQPGKLYDTYAQWRNVPPGRHVVVARARDDSGNVANSAPLVIEAVESTPEIAHASLTLMLEATPLLMGQGKDDNDAVFFLGAPGEYYRVEVAKHPGEWELVAVAFSGNGFFHASLEHSDVLSLEHYRATRLSP